MKKINLLKRFFSFFLIFALFSSANLVFSFSAEASATVAEPPVFQADENGLPAKSNSAVKNVQDVILEGLQNFSTKINITSFKIHRSEISSIYRRILNANPQLFYLSGALTFNYYTSSGNVTNIFPRYTTSVSEAKERQPVFEAAFEKALAEIPQNVSDVEKILAVHDYIAYTARYAGGTDKSNAYGILVSKGAQCKGYAMTFRLFMNALGITNQTCGNANHIWNMVELDGEWYHVDVTWDDPTGNQLGRVRHTNLLRSDEGMRATGHSGWYTAPVAESTLYDSYVWSSVWGKMDYLNGKWYYALGRSNPRKLMSYDFNTGEAVTLYSYRASWPSSGGVWIHNSYSAVYNERIYYNGAKGIYSVDLNGNDHKALLTETLEGRNRIYEMEIIDSVLKYRIKASPATNTYVEKAAILNPDGSFAYFGNSEAPAA